MSVPYTMQALQELADDGVHLLEVDDAGLLATVAECEKLRARVAELEREVECGVDGIPACHGPGKQDYDWCHACLLSQYRRARAEAARLREALGEFLGCPMVVSEGTNPVIVTIHVARERVEKWRAALASAPSAAGLPWSRDHADHGRGTDESGPDESDCGCRLTTQQHECAKAGCGFCRVSQARAALSAPEPTPRDMRVAEAVVMEAAFLVRHPSGPEGEDGYSLDDIAQRIETLDLAAVVAKAVGT